MKIPFLNRGTNTDQSNLPAEVQEYYQSERRERVGIAWLLAGGTLILTLLLASGLFFGGRWAYNKIANKDNGPETSIQEDSKDQKGENSSAAEDTNENDSENTGTSSATTTDPPTAAGQSSVAPATTSGPSALPSTGPTGDDL